MVVEYIRYKIDPSRNDEFDEAYRRAGALLDAEGHLQGFRQKRRLQALPRSHPAVLQRHRGDDRLPSHCGRLTDG